jgi:hypothetical protein
MSRHVLSRHVPYTFQIDASLGRRLQEIERGPKRQWPRGWPCARRRPAVRKSVRPAPACRKEVRAAGTCGASNTAGAELPIPQGPSHGPCPQFPIPAEEELLLAAGTRRIILRHGTGRGAREADRPAVGRGRLRASVGPTSGRAGPGPAARPSGRATSGATR